MLATSSHNDGNMTERPYTIEYKMTMTIQQLCLLRQQLQHFRNMTRRSDIEDCRSDGFCAPFAFSVSQARRRSLNHLRGQVNLASPIWNWSTGRVQVSLSVKNIFPLYTGYFDIVVVIVNYNNYNNYNNICIFVATSQTGAKMQSFGFRTTRSRHTKVLGQLYRLSSASILALPPRAT